MTNDVCPCGSRHGYAACCGPLHAGEPAADAEALMRSRYSAYVLRRVDYLQATWHPRTRPDTLELAQAVDHRTVWLGLQVHAHRQIDDDHAEVEFVARYRVGGGRAVRLAETSRFIRTDGVGWLYVDGDVRGR